MIVVRNVFRVKFGKAKEAIEAWKEMLTLTRSHGVQAKDTRILTDLVGPFYTVVFEHTFESLAAFEQASGQFMKIPEFGAAYARIVNVTESGYREIFTVAAE